MEDERNWNKNKDEQIILDKCMRLSTAHNLVGQSVNVN